MALKIIYLFTKGKYLISEERSVEAYVDMHSFYTAW